jgi:3-polyprenyl-4-hydroxybenzoate decarboxylase
MEREVLPFDNITRGKRLSCDRCLKRITEYTIMLREKILVLSMLWGLLRITSNGGILLAAMTKYECQISETK